MLDALEGDILIMSRSCKKHPYCGDQSNKKFGKKCANRRVRYYKGDLANGKSYIKLFEQWDICDFGWILTWEQFRNNWLSCYYNDMTEKELYIYWKTRYKCK